MVRQRLARIAVITACALLLVGLGVDAAIANLAGCSNCIEAGDIATGAVNAAELDDDLDDTISQNDIASGGVAAAELASNSVGLSELTSAVETRAYSVYHNDPIDLTGTGPNTLLTLDVPAGSFVIIGKTNAYNTGTLQQVNCTVAAGGDTDEAFTTLAANGSSDDLETLTLTVVHTFASAGSATLACDDNGGSVFPNDSKLTAIKVDALTNTAG